MSRDYFDIHDVSRPYVKELSVSNAEYRDAINTLLQFAFGDTHSSVPAAMVLLATYDYYKFKIAVNEMGSLDYKLFDAALKVVRGRVLLSANPASVIENGEEIFKRLSDEWGDFFIKN